MNSKPGSTFAVVLAAALLAGTLARADDYGNSFTSIQGGASVGAEAAKAVADRVFGVKGEAADVKYHAIQLSNHSPVNAGIRSLIVPGWGQMFNRQPIKAAALFMVVAGAGYGAYSSYNSSRNSWDEYRSRGSRNDSSYDDYSRQRNQALILGGATAILWLYSSWDAYQNAYNPLWSREPSVDVALDTGGASVEWRRRF